MSDFQEFLVWIINLIEENVLRRFAYLEAQPQSMSRRVVPRDSRGDDHGAGEGATAVTSRWQTAKFIKR